MKGYIAVISRNPDADADADDAYEVHFPDIEGCVAFGSTVSQAMHEAERELNRYVQEMANRRMKTAVKLPAPKPATAMLSEAEREGAVAAVCMRPRAA